MARRPKVVGGLNVRRFLRQADENITASVKAELADFAEAVRLDAAKTAGTVSRTLAQNIEARGSRNGLRVRVGIITKRARREAYFARWVEFGTKPHAIGKGMHPGTKARPYLIPAFKINARYFRPRLAEKIRYAIRVSRNGGRVATTKRLPSE